VVGRVLRWMTLMSLGLVVLMSGCRAPGELVRDEAQAFAEEVAPITERLMQALNTGDEEAFTSEMTEQMTQASSGTGFVRMRAQIWGVIGDFESAEMRQVLRQQDVWNVVYRADFSEEKGVVLRVVYAEIEGEYRVAGLWLDSPKLRASQ
jgi:hypothetical protein